MDPAACAMDPAACAMDPADRAMDPADRAMDPAAVSTQGSAPTMKRALESQRGGGSGAQASLRSVPSSPWGAEVKIGGGENRSS